MGCRSARPAECHSHSVNISRTGCYFEYQHPSHNSQPSASLTPHLTLCHWCCPSATYQGYQKGARKNRLESLQLHSSSKQVTGCVRTSESSLGSDGSRRAQRTPEKGSYLVTVCCPGGIPQEKEKVCGAESRGPVQACGWLFL